MLLPDFKSKESKYEEQCNMLLNISCVYLNMLTHLGFIGNMKVHLT